MQNFIYANPTKILFGEGMIANIMQEIPQDANVLIIYGGGSIHSNGVYQQVKNALKDHQCHEFGGIEPNPHYETCLKAVEMIKKHQIDFLLAVGGGSVLDATKFIAAAARFEGTNPWDILLKRGKNVTAALPFGSVITLPATGSEMNSGGVITRASTEEKMSFSSSMTFPKFSVLDPVTTYSLPKKQIANGIVDAFIHVMEQYLTDNQDNALLQDYMSESIVKVLIEVAPQLMNDAPEYNSRANFMWAATWALNGWIACGVKGDWATHMIGHELTALYGLDHAQTLSIVLPGLLTLLKGQKQDKICQLGRNVFHLHCQNTTEQVDQTIMAIEGFFHSVGMKTRLSDYGLQKDSIEDVVERIRTRNWRLGEQQNIDSEMVRRILSSRE